MTALTVLGYVVIGWIAASLVLFAAILVRDWLRACAARAYGYRHRACILTTDHLLDLVAALDIEVVQLVAERDTQALAAYERELS